MKKDKAGKNEKKHKKHKKHRDGADPGQAAAAAEVAPPDANGQPEGDRKKKHGKKDKNRQDDDVALAVPAGPSSAKAKLTGKDYARELAKLHGELVKLQEWVKYKGLKICVIFEGRDGAGKGGTIKALTERVSPRVFRTIALPAPTDREKSQMYVQRYLPHLPAAGEIVIFDRSWYNRAGVERVMGFTSEELVKKFLTMVPLWEKGMVDSGVILIKYWLEVSEKEQTRRLADRIDDPRKIWKLSPMDLKSYSRWYDYSRARDDMFTATDSGFAPWYVVDSNDKKRARLNIISHFLGQIPYKSAPREKVHLPKRQGPGGYQEPNYSYKRVPEKY
jgi:polyphosphate kinase 2